VTFELDPGATVICTYTNTLQVELEACSPGYWRQPQHFGSYPWETSWGANQVVPINFHNVLEGGALYEATLYGEVFGTGGVDPTNLDGDGIPFEVESLTFPLAIRSNGGGFNRLLRHGTAAYLNAVTINYDLTPAEVVAAVNAAWLGGVGSPAFNNALQSFEELLEDENCPLGRDTLPSEENFGNGIGGGGIGQQ
jgi:hypothetical protein